MLTLLYCYPQYEHTMDWAIDIAIKDLINLPSWDVMANYKRQYDDFKKLVQRVLSPGQAGPDGSRDTNDGVAYAWPDSRVSTVLYNILVYYYCDNQQGMGGNSTTGQVARKFFGSQNLMARVVLLVPPQQKENIRKLFVQLSLILRLVSSREKVDCSKLRSFHYSC